jgi:hypothetical protein
MRPLRKKALKKNSGMPIINPRQSAVRVCKDKENDKHAENIRRSSKVEPVFFDDRQYGRVPW